MSSREAGITGVSADTARAFLRLPTTDRREAVTLAVLLSAAGVLLIIGWKLLWFLTDDAYISFRYVSNAALGHGYVWNPAPFRPVEGYTNFLWILLLDIVWRVFKVSPPQSANYISLVFSFLTLLLVSSIVLRMRWYEALRRGRMILLAFVLVGIVTNRTFLAWSSSGLETAMFNFFLILWINSCVFTSSTYRWYYLVLTLPAAAVYLIRPDGLIFFAATVLILYVTLRRHKHHLRCKRTLGILPLVIVPGHLVWRKATYWEWLPNSYYAKYVGLWPESGLRYALSFVLEYGLWVWLVLLVYAAIRWSRRWEPRPSWIGSRADRLSTWVVGGALAAHAAYYTVAIGGDHFEYRVYSHLIPIVFISAIWLLNQSRARLGVSLAFLLVLVALSWPIPWSHWALSKDLTTREQTHKLFVPVSEHWPAAFGRYAQLFDDQQAWLIDHYVCIRHQEHKINCEALKASLPSREEGLRLPSSDFPVLAFPAVGVVSWVMPRINIIDLHGINDYVIARSSVDPGLTRMMAHDRMAPEGYVECFRPNVELLPGSRVIIRERSKALTAEDIISCETRWTRVVKGEGKRRP
jgi:arabinofuranosyltransferase